MVFSRVLLGFFAASDIGRSCRAGFGRGFSRGVPALAEFINLANAITWLLCHIDAVNALGFDHYLFLRAFGRDWTTLSVLLPRPCDFE